MPVKVVQRIEQGARRMTLGEAASMASGVGIPLDDIVTAAKSTTFEEAPMGRPRGHEGKP